jgi:hypothetical protein
MIRPTIPPALLMEAIHSVALSHGERCTCHVCRASAGDVASLARVVLALVEAEEEEADERPDVEPPPGEAADRGR